MKINVRTTKLESLTFDAESWSVDEAGILWLSSQDGTGVATFARGEWRYVMAEVEA